MVRRHWARTRAGSTSTAFEDATCGFRRRNSLPERRCGCIGPQGMVSADLLGRDEVLHALQQDERRQRSRGHRANANSPAIGRSASAACADVAISVTPRLFSVAAVAKTIASDTSELNATPVMVSMRMPASSGPALVVVYLACTELLKPLAMRIRHPR